MTRHGTTMTMVVALAASTLLAGCGESRSPEAFCKVYRTEKANYLQKYSDRADQAQTLSDSDPLAGLVIALASGVEAIGDVVVIFDKLDKVAPDDIEPDIAIIRDSLRKQIDSAGDSIQNPVGGLANALVTGISTNGSWQRVGQYIEDNHCDG